MERRAINNPNDAEAIVRESDRVRSAFIERFEGCRWDKATCFDMVIGTGKIPEKLAIPWLIQALNALQAQAAPGALTVDTILVDPMLVSIISEELNIRASHSHS